MKTLETAQFDYSQTLFLPQTDFPMKANLPERELMWITRWETLRIYDRQIEQNKANPPFVLHDGPPYANGHIHIGHALNKILKDFVTRSMQMSGFNCAYIPGWDCHGLPIEWKVEEQYRDKGHAKDDVPVIEFREACRAFAKHWVSDQREDFRRLGVRGDWANPYLTMSFQAEAQIARELWKLNSSGQLYRGSKPVMWSVVERTALAEAEIEYFDVVSDAVYVKFGLSCDTEAKAAEPLIGDASIVIFTTTPWTIPANRAVAYSPTMKYGVYRVTRAIDHSTVTVTETLIASDKLASELFAKLKAEKYTRIRDFDPTKTVLLRHPLFGLGDSYKFDVPLLPSDHVTDATGSGFVHIAPGHGSDDFNAWLRWGRELDQMGIDKSIPYCVDDAGFYTEDVSGFSGSRVIDDQGKTGDASDRVIRELTNRDCLLGHEKVTHSYPHSWRSKKRVIFRNTPQWFVHMDKPIPEKGRSLRELALHAVDGTSFYPATGQSRLRSMIAERPDWVLSRQRSWGVPIALFVNKRTGSVLDLPSVNERIAAAFASEGADAWFDPGAKHRFLADAVSDHDEWEKVDDILDVWFDSGTTHSWVLRDNAKGALAFPADLYLEGSDQHRGWFQSSLLESCATNGEAPYRAVLTHGFILDGAGRKMSKSLGNTVKPQDVISSFGADILRLWVASSDYSEDLRIGPEIIQTTVDNYRRLRNAMRWLVGNLSHYRVEDEVSLADMPPIERFILHRLRELDQRVKDSYNKFDFKTVVFTLSNFITLDLSAFYFDIRKDALYCDASSAIRRRASLSVLNQVYRCLTTWLAPILPFTMEEVWLARFPSEDASIHLLQFAQTSQAWEDSQIAAQFAKVRELRKVITGALEVQRKAKVIGSSLEAAPIIYISDDELYAAVIELDLAELSITSAVTVFQSGGPEDAFRLADVPGVSVVFERAKGKRCARSWRILPEVGSDPEFPDLSVRDAEAMREWRANGWNGS